ncbi:hypothetical protein [Rhizobium halophytocola]|uniref:Uncharacterized protein n=1 Tax=Rhizobium halophytocola TaxID=735519 RepID=A0ABS4DZ39_9HYPH|nr:hypothetical protein [Rhizobium halophytocola]MBP1850909.1 hypothetical protein [Rhizobium halophytocola]
MKRSISTTSGDLAQALRALVLGRLAAVARPKGPSVVGAEAGPAAARGGQPPEGAPEGAAEVAKGDEAANGSPGKARR